MTRWGYAFWACIFGTLVLIGVCNTYGVGAAWPFPVIGAGILAIVVTGIMWVRTT